MRSDEPGPWELHRSLERLSAAQDAGFAQINARLDRLVTTETFTAERQRVDEKLRDLAQDIADERALRQKEASTLGARIDGQHRATVEAKRWAIGTFIAGSGVVVALLALLSR